MKRPIAPIAPIALTVSLLLNALLLGAVSWNAYLVDQTPAGHVSVSQVGSSDSELWLARAAP
jgi:hypothetical protein